MDAIVKTDFSFPGQVGKYATCMTLTASTL